MEQEHIKAYWQQWTKDFKDASYCIYSTRKDWSVEEFYQSGVKDWNKYFEPLMNQLPDRDSVMEIGVGIGRVLFASKFNRSYGIDISEGMLSLAEIMKDQLGHKSYYKFGLPSTLDFIAHDSISFIYSIICFQHIPNKDEQIWYIRQIDRILKPGGIAKLMIQSETYKQEFNCGIGASLSKSDIESNLTRCKIVAVEPSEWCVQAERNQWYVIKKEI